MTTVRLVCITMVGSEYVLWDRNGITFPQGELKDGEQPADALRRLVEEWSGTKAPKLEMVDLVSSAGELLLVARAMLVEEPKNAPKRAKRMELPAGARVRVARDSEEGRGPLAGLSAGLAEVRTELALLAAGDMPELSAAVLAEMLRVAGEAQVDAVALREGETFRPLPAVLVAGPTRETAAALLHRGEGSLMTLLGALRLAVIDEPTWHALDPTGATLFDVDRPEDLNRSRG